MGCAEHKDHDDCCEHHCWTRIKHFCVCVKTAPSTGGIQGPRVIFCEEDLRKIHMKSGAGMPFGTFSEQVYTEANRAAEEAWPTIVVAQAALSGLPSEQSLISIRFCIRIGPIRICVEWLL